MLNETQMLIDGAARYHRRIDQARSRGSASNQSKAASNLVGFLTHTASESLSEEILSTGAAKNHSASPKILEVGVRICCAVGAKVLVDKVAFGHNRQTLSSVLSTVGNAIHEQAWMSRFESLRGPLLLEAIRTRNLDKLYGESKLKILIKHELGDDWEDWTRSTKIQVGAKVVSHLLWATNFFEVFKTREGRRTKQFVAPTEELLTQMRDQDIRLGLLTPMLLPTTSAPQDWTSPTEGGYSTIHRTLVKGLKGSQLRNLDEVDMPEVYDAVNRLQKVAYTVNSGVLTVAEHFWREDLPIAGMPRQEKLPQPAFPPDQVGLKWPQLTDEQKDQRQKWKAEVSELHSTDRSNVGKIISTRVALETAARFECETIYFPQELDFRGRVYCSPIWNFQADKLSKALIMFDHGEPITEEGAPWYMIHGANTWGIDKVSLEERIEWVFDNEDKIVECSEDPINNLWWTDADSPWEFLAWCLEAGEWIEGGRDPGFISHIPVHMDQTCSALQHWSAALRDSDGARRVNLTPGPRSDVYLEVLEQVKQQLLEEDSEDSRWFIHSPYFSRTLVKTPMMARTYAGTKRGVEGHVLRHMRQTDQLISAQNQAGSVSVGKLARWVANHIWSAINSSLRGTTEGMEFCLSVAKIANALDCPMSWTTPTGFFVQTSYFSQKHRRVKTQFMGQVYTPQLGTPTEKLDKRKQLSSIAPNLVHSLDAALLMKAVNAGGVDVMTVHDSFGVHARHAQEFNLILRDEFAKLYESDVLWDWLVSCLPAALTDSAPQKVQDMLDDLVIPSKGDLDVKLIKNSTYAFS